MFGDPPGVVAVDLPGHATAYTVTLSEPVEQIVPLGDGKRLAVISATTLYIIQAR